MLGFGKKKKQTGVQLGISTGDQNISIACIRRNPGLPPVLERCEIERVENLSLQDAEISRLVQSRKLADIDSVGTLDIGDYNLLLVEAPDVQPEELRAAIRWRIKDLIDFHIDDAVVDVFEVPGQNVAGKNRMMYAVVARADVVRNKVEQLIGAGLSLEVIDIPELALRNISTLLPEDVGGVALVYVGEDSGLITITRQGKLYLSRRIDEGIQRLKMMDDDMDDQQKTRKWLDDIIIEVQRSLDYYESHFSQPQVSALALAPLPFTSAAVTEYMSAQLGLPVRILNINDMIDVKHPLNAEQQSRGLMAIGAALREESVAL